MYMSFMITTTGNWLNAMPILTAQEKEINSGTASII